MKTARRPRPSSVPGVRIGKKRSDRRWQDPDGAEWDSRFEYDVYRQLKESGLDVRRCTKQDSHTYTAAVKLGRCTQCKSTDVVTERSYTPDLFVRTKAAEGDSNDSGYYIETKGYIRSEQRRLLRSFCKANANLDLRFIVEKDIKLTKKMRITEWVTIYLRKPVMVWVSGMKMPEAGNWPILKKI